MDMMKSLLGLENCRIKFSTGEGDYEGTISQISPEIQLLVLTKLIWLPKNMKMGTLTFRAKEIEAFSVIGRSETPKNIFSPTYLYERDCNKPTIFDDEFDDDYSVNESELCSVSDADEKQYIFDQPPFNDLPIDNIILDELNQDFLDAIQHFYKQDFIGLSAECPKMGRHQSIHWLCFSTVSCTFLFDVKSLGESAFSNGLRDILEDSRIVKIVHDCREISDCLFHQYNTRLSNIFDTQVADFIINQQHRRDGKICHNVRTLNSCLAQHLNIPDDFLLRRRKRAYQDDLVFYGLRPIPNDLRDLFTHNVIYLRRLRQELDICLTEPLNRCVDIYMKSMCKKTDRELQLEDFSKNVVPDEMLSEEIKVFRFKDHVDIPAVVSSGPPYREIQDSFKEFVDYCKKNGIADS